MSKQELMELVAPLSTEEWRELREILDEAPQKEDATLATFFEWQSSQPSLDLPCDFSINHDHYIHGASKVVE